VWGLYVKGRFGMRMYDLSSADTILLIAAILLR
jgi:hypothetical protein